MDPVTGAAVAIVVWFLAASFGWWLVVLISSAIGFSLAVDQDAGLALGIFIGKIIGFFWFAFAIIQSIIQVVHLAQLLVN